MAWKQKLTGSGITNLDASNLITGMVGEAWMSGTHSGRPPGDDQRVVSRSPGRIILSLSSLILHDHDEGRAGPTARRRGEKEVHAEVVALPSGEVKEVVVLVKYRFRPCG